MTALVPQKVASLIVQEVNEYITIAERHMLEDDPKYLDWLNRIEAMNVPELAGLRAYTYALVASVRGDVYDFERSIADARRGDVERSDILVLQLIGYANLSYATKASSAFQQHVDIKNGNLQGHLNIGACIGSFQRVSELMVQAKRANLDLRWGAIEEWARASAILADRNCSDEECAKLLDVVGEVLRPRSLFWLDAHPKVLPDEEQGTVLLRFRVAVSPDEAATMSGEYVQKLVEAGLDDSPLMVNFVGVKFAS